MFDPTNQSLTSGCVPLNYCTPEAIFEPSTQPHTSGCVPLQLNVDQEDVFEPASQSSNLALESLHLDHPYAKQHFEPDSSIVEPDTVQLPLPLTTRLCKSCFRPVKGHHALGPIGTNCKLTPILTK